MKNKILITLCLFFGIITNAQSLQDYLNIAEKNSLELQSKYYRYQSTLEKINEVGSLPNTTIGLGYFVQETETRVGAQKAKISISQMVPWFGTLSAKKESTSYLAKAQLNTINLAKRKLFLEVKTSYYELYELKATETILNEHISILKTYEKLALSELENNKSTMVDVLKIKMEMNEVSNNLFFISENLNTKKNTFNLLLNRNEDSNITIIDTILITENDDLLDKYLLHENPKLLQLDNLKKSLIQSEIASKKESLPTIAMGLDYLFVENRPLEGILDNGKDIIMPMVSLSIPLFSKKYSSKQKQLQLEQKEINTTKSNVTNKLLTLFENTMANLKNAKASIKTQTENTYQANQAKKVLLVAYQTSKIDFKQLLEIQQLKLKFQLKKITSEKEYAIQKATLEFLTTNN